MDRHMNIFESYAQGKPIENNLSRALAIVLEENKLLFERFVDVINGKLSPDQTLIMKPSNPEEISVNIQRYAADIATTKDGLSRIIPVTLTPNEPMKEENNGGVDNPKPDIFVLCGNDIIIIEVKRDLDIAEAQVKHQAQSIINKVKGNLNADIFVTSVINLMWPEIIKMLIDVDSLLESRDIILTHYIIWLKEYFARWFPVDSFNDKMEAESVKKRLDILANNCARKLENIYEKLGENFSAGKSFQWDGSKIEIIPSWGYLREFHLLPYYGNASKEFQGVKVCFWLGNNAGQSWNLFQRNSDNYLAWTRIKVLSVDDSKLEMSIKPYIKFSDSFGRYVMDACVPHERLGNDKGKLLTKLEQFNGKWHRDKDPKWDWQSLKRTLIDDFGARDFEGNFASKFENSGRTVVLMSLGYEISVNIPVETLSKLDKNNKDSDSVADFLAHIVEVLRNLIENN